MKIRPKLLMMMETLFSNILDNIAVSNGNDESYFSVMYYIQENLIWSQVLASMKVPIHGKLMRNFRSYLRPL